MWGAEGTCRPRSHVVWTARNGLDVANRSYGNIVVGRWEGKLGQHGDA
jgi:hypothetical protein